MLALVSNSFLRSRYSMEMWCPDDIGRVDGIGLGRLLGEEHASTPQIGVEAPRLLKRSLPRLYYCCCCGVLWLCVVVVCCVVLLCCVVVVLLLCCCCVVVVLLLLVVVVVGCWLLVVGCCCNYGAVSLWDTTPSPVPVCCFGVCVLVCVGVVVCVVCCCGAPHEGLSLGGPTTP